MSTTQKSANEWSDGTKINKLCCKIFPGNFVKFSDEAQSLMMFPGF